MSLYTTSLNSGSNGNCYYIGNETEAVLVDAGISCRETEKRMKRLGLSMFKIKAAFISHEHIDHIKGVEQISKKYSLPVYITDLTLKKSHLRLEANLTRPFCAFEPIYVGGLSIHPFPKFHDAADPFSFVVEGKGTKIGVFTDIGAPCTHLVGHFKQCHAAFLEANYDEQMLENGRYPIYLKRRISGDKGHLSNRQALELFIGHKPAFMNHRFLSHLSKENNHPELAHALFSTHAGDTKIIIASRYRETAVYRIGEPDQTDLLSYRNTPDLVSVQATLF